VIQAVIFDLDDTLYSERDYVRSGFRAVAEWCAANLGIPASSGYAELESLFERGVRQETFDQWLGSRNAASPERVAQLVRVYREHEPAIRSFPEAAPLLQCLRTGHRLGLLSDGWLAVQRRKLSALGLAQHFDAIVFSDELGRELWKPHTRPFEVILQKLGCSAGEAVYVGDNPAKDFLGARRAGLATIWVRRSGAFYTGHIPATPEHAADLTIPSLDGLIAALGQFDALRLAAQDEPLPSLAPRQPERSPVS
jgi:putative hydrolase of the HAD superfamily